jgi:hypothetical protein
MSRRTAYVNVRLNDVSRKIEWREIDAVESLEEAIKVAESQDDVEVVFEASWIPGGCVT